MATSIEVWVSKSGTGDLAFELAGTVPDSPGGWSLTDVPVEWPNVYHYRARRYDSGLDAYSDWSNIVTVSPPQVSEGGIPNNMPVISGVDSKIAIAQEAIEGNFVQVTKRLERASGTLQQTAAPIFDDSIQGDPSQYHKDVPGIAEVAGPMSLNATPEGPFVYFLNATWGLPTTVAVAAAGGVGAHNLHTWKNNKFAHVPLTAVERQAEYFFVTSGIGVNRMELTLAKTQTTPVRAEMELFGLKQFVDGTDVAAIETKTGLDTSVIDPMPHWAAVRGILTVDGTVLGYATDITITIERNLERIQGFNGYRGASGLYSTGVTLTANFTAFFMDDSLYKRYFGQLPSAVRPYGMSMDTIPGNVVLTIAGKPTADGWSPDLLIRLPKALLTPIDKPVEGRGAIMQRVTLNMMHDPVTGTDLLMSLRNSMTAANVGQMGTLMTGVPADAVHPYNTEAP